MVYIKNDRGEYVCPDCGITKKKQNTMHYHMKKHAEVSSNVCKFCKKGFLHKQSLDLHLKHQAGRGEHPATSSDDLPEYECPFESCTFNASSKGNCRTHCMRVHLATEVNKILERGSAKEISCKNCLKDFDSLGIFYYHSIGCVSLEMTDPRHAILAQFT
jgi:hypothetical protein